MGLNLKLKNPSATRRLSWPLTIFTEGKFNEYFKGYLRFDLQVSTLRWFDFPPPPPVIALSPHSHFWERGFF